MEDGEPEPEEPVKVLEAQGTFDELMVWGHEILPAADDTFVKGVEEWVRFAEMVGASSNTLMIPRLTLMVDARDGYAIDRRK
jgi:ribonuclease H2 subunit C